MELPDNLKNLKFDLADCKIETARQHEKNRPVRPGVSNGEIDYSKYPGLEPEQIMNMVTVTHIPTNISSTVTKFSPKRNREIAIEIVKGRVEERIAETILAYQAMVEKNEKKSTPKS